MPDFAAPPQPVYGCVLAANPTAIRDAMVRIMASSPLAALDGDQRGTAELVLAEVLNNIAEHAYAGGSGDIRLSLRLTGGGLDCLVLDRGVEMPGGALPGGHLPTAVGVALDDLPEGGFGWHLILTLTRDLHYARKDGQNRLAFLIPA